MRCRHPHLGPRNTACDGGVCPWRCAAFRSRTWRTEICAAAKTWRSDPGQPGLRVSIADESAGASACSELAILIDEVDEMTCDGRVGLRVMRTLRVQPPTGMFVRRHARHWASIVNHHGIVDGESLLDPSTCR